MHAHRARRDELESVDDECLHWTAGLVVECEDASPVRCHVHESPTASLRFVEAAFEPAGGPSSSNGVIAPFAPQRLKRYFAGQASLPSARQVANSLSMAIGYVSPWSRIPRSMLAIRAAI
jgi:hypothetical protein